MSKILAFIDGENLILRYQAMVDAGCVKKRNVVHQRDQFVWSPEITTWRPLDVVRVSYYTSVVGDDAAVTNISEFISRTRFDVFGGGRSGSGSLIPRVHKRPKKGRKEKTVDVEITMDVMRALAMPIDGILLLTGDGDYLPLLREITRNTSKQLHLGAFSSGLSAGLRSCSENFLDLDDMFFSKIVRADSQTP